MDGNLFGLNPAGKLLYLQVLGLEIREVRVVAREDIRKTERQQMHASRDSRTQVSFSGLCHVALVVLHSCEYWTGLQCFFGLKLCNW